MSALVSAIKNKKFIKGMGIHRSREHCLDIAKTLQTADIKKPPKCLTTGVLEFLGLDRGDYIRIHLVPIHTYLTSSLQTSLQNQTKREGYEKDDFVVE